MSWRTVVISERAKLDYQLGFLVVRGKNTVKVHINEIRVVIVESTAVSMTAYLLNELTKNKVKVIFCDEKRNPSSELISYYGSYDSSEKIRKQMNWREHDKAAVWREIIIEKIKKQSETLCKYNKSESKILEKYLKEVELGDASNREAHAAKVYFNSLFGVGFSRAQDNSINAALNYGYSLILSCFTREISANGYLTQIGIFHENMLNPFNLASDLMEPFRPIIDQVVYEMDPERFETEEKRELLRVLEKTVEISYKKEVLPNAIKVYVRTVFEALNDRDVSELRFYKNEL